MIRARRLAREHAPHYGKSAYARIPHDAYFTVDERCVQALLDMLPELRARGPVWECAAGGYDLAEDLRAAGVRPIVCSDIKHYRPPPKGQRPSRLQNFLGCDRAPLGVRAIVTNPPNKLSHAFVEHALRLMQKVRGLVAMLVPYLWDAAPGRKHLLEGHPAFRMRIALTIRPWWFEQRTPRPGQKKTGPREHWQWLVWDWARDPRRPAEARYA